jgi:hypothetical protein
MIRDPSDGSVRELPKVEVSGLRVNAERAEQLERSREWLRNYYAKKGQSNGNTDDTPTQG